MSKRQYYFGKICLKHFELNGIRRWGKCPGCLYERRRTPEYRAKQRAYQMTPRSKARRRALTLSPKYIDRHLSEAYRERNDKRRRLNPEKYLWHSAKSRAQRRGIPFEIDISDVVIPDKCPIFGFPISMFDKERDRRPSLDQIKPRHGYVKGNTIVISALANRLKSDATWGELRQMADFYERLEREALKARRR
jgi:hypothetical protein